MQQKYVVTIQRKDTIDNIRGYISKNGRPTLFRERAKKYESHAKAAEGAELFLENNKLFGNLKIELA